MTAVLRLLVDLWPAATYRTAGGWHPHAGAGQVAMRNRTPQSWGWQR